MSRQPTTAAPSKVIDVRDAVGLVRDGGKIFPLMVEAIECLRSDTKYTAIVSQELQKLALYVDASPHAPKELDHEAIDAVARRHPPVVDSANVPGRRSDARLFDAERREREQKIEQDLGARLADALGEEDGPGERHLAEPLRHLLLEQAHPGGPAGARRGPGGLPEVRREGPAGLMRFAGLAGLMGRVQVPD